MRAVLGLALLALFFWAAVAWQENLSQDLREEREHVHGTAALAASAEGWSTLVIGRPSGAEPLVPEEPRSGWAPVPAGAAAGGGDASEAAPAGRPAVVRYTVHSGDVLGRICQDYYGAERGTFANLAELVNAVAAYNELASPDGLGAGDTLLLPDLAVFETR